ncbi:cyclin-F-like, partial [Centrocercus urophasianus]|uniref:cyclin-F-like n=1 Tax=Centrocercus urophasianus TaxID=9002 RepID=UPI001C64E281
GSLQQAAQGGIQVPTIVDYKEVLSNIVSLERRTLHLYSFICELSLLNTSLFGYSPARLAAAALLLAKILHGHAHPWTSQLSECTGFSLEDLLPCVLRLHQKWRREDSAQDDRGSLVTTPTAELSTQEESLLDSFLDWSLDSCSGYEGDQESEGERDGDVTSPSGILDVTVVYVDPAEHCCQDSSDEDSLSVECPGHAAPPRKARTPDETHRVFSACVASRNPSCEGSSGYSSVSGASPKTPQLPFTEAPLKPTSALSVHHIRLSNSCRAIQHRGSMSLLRCC